MGRTFKYYPSGVFSCQRHICSTLTRNWVVVLIAVTLMEFNEFKELKEFREFSVISNLLTL